MADPFELTVPVDANYRVLAGQVAAKYTELAGGSLHDVQALSASLASAIDQVISGASAQAGVALAFQLTHGVIGVTARCEGRSATIRHSVSSLL